MENGSITTKIFEIDINLISPTENNPRQITKADFEKLKNSLKNFQKMRQIREVIIDENNRILGGHQRVKALKAIGETKVLVKQVIGLSEDEKSEFLIKDNIANGEWDTDILANEWSDYPLDEWGLTLPELEKDDKEIEEDDPPAVDSVEPRSQYGDIWKLGKHRLMVGDSTKVEDVSALMGGALAKLVITDPPYNVDYEGGTGMKIMNDKMADSAFYNFLADAYRAMDANMAEGAGYYIWHADLEGYNFRGALREVGWELRQTIIWVKNTLVLGRQDYQWRHEPCLYGWKGGKAHYFVDKRAETTVVEDEVDFEKMKASEMRELLKKIYSLPSTAIHENKPTANELHPTMKPVKLIAKLVENSSEEGWEILDPFGGSGTTLMACQQLNRKAYIMELDPKYADVIIERYESFTGETAELLERRNNDTEEQ